MIAGQNRWDVRKVLQVFEVQDAKQILRCPIANTREDVLIRSHRSTGMFMTRSAYSWLMKQFDAAQEQSPVWKTLAKAQVLPKIRIFGWRLVYEALPVGKKLGAANLGSAKMVSEYAQIVLVDTGIPLEGVMNQTECDRGSRWSKPSHGVIKLNVDGALCGESRKAAVGTVARDHYGLIIAGRAF
ncbi:hypothetical protein V6N12_070813 [Hibiscus sabdariffa]|uniref:Reverse transcriptase zinc-binding domain-containing protein n=1 Tax=Hibiscus sabdariffa TaxID=183260 RepID=A0ABR2FHY5_9ROSI